MVTHEWLTVAGGDDLRKAADNATALAIGAFSNSLYLPKAAIAFAAKNPLCTLRTLSIFSLHYEYGMKTYWSVNTPGCKSGRVIYKGVRFLHHTKVCTSDCSTDYSTTYSICKKKRKFLLAQKYTSLHPGQARRAAPLAAPTALTWNRHHFPMTSQLYSFSMLQYALPGNWMCETCGVFLLWQ